MAKRPKRDDDPSLTPTRDVRPRPVVLPRDFMAQAMTNVIREKARKANSDGVLTLEEIAALRLGLPWPSFSLIYLCDRDDMPLSYSIMIAGDFMTGKSALAREFARIVLWNNGLVHSFEVENKDDPAALAGMLQYPLYQPPEDLLWYPYRASSSDQWMKLFQLAWAETEKAFGGKATLGQVNKAKKGRGGRPVVPVEDDDEDDEEEVPLQHLLEQPVPRPKAGVSHHDRPVAFVVDSVNGAAAESTLVKLQEAGGPQREFSVVGWQNSVFAKALPRFLSFRPYVFIGVYQNKPSPNDNGILIDNITGARTTSFSDSLQLRASRVKHEKRADYSYILVKLNTRKNSTGEPFRQIEVAYRWWSVRTIDPDTGKKGWAKRFSWDWGAATTDVLVRLALAKTDGAKIAKAVSEVLDIHQSSGKRYWSNRLGIPKDKPVDAHTFGQMIDLNGPLVLELTDAIRINPSRKFVPGLPMEDAAAHAAYLEDRHTGIYADWHTDMGDILDQVVSDDAGEPIAESPPPSSLGRRARPEDVSHGDA